MSVGELGEITVLHVDDDEAFLDLTAEMLTRESDRLSVLGETDPERVLDRLAAEQVDCVVCDYDMPKTNGLELLDAVREEYPDLPFILFTGKGSEEVASEAISRGVTDYLRKRSGRESYQLLRNRIEHAAERRHARLGYQRIFEEAASGIVIHDPETGEIHDVNRRYCEQLGYEREEVLEMTVGDISADDPAYSDERAQRLINRAADQGDVTVDWRNRTADGEEFPVEVQLSHAVIGGRAVVLAMVRDVTERERQREQVRAERDRFAALFEQFPEPTIAYEFVDGEPTLRRVNVAFEEVFGYDAGEIIGEAVDDVVVPSDRAEEAAGLNERVRAGEAIDEVLERETVDGVRSFRFRNIAVPTEDGPDGFGVYSVVRDGD